MTLPFSKRLFNLFNSLYCPSILSSICNEWWDFYLVIWYYSSYQGQWMPIRVSSVWSSKHELKYERPNRMIYFIRQNYDRLIVNNCVLYINKVFAIYVISTLLAVYILPFIISKRIVLILWKSFQTFSTLIFMRRPNISKIVNFKISH